ncbi:hypothetical protein KI387_042074 [Taxus chinensis]|uniref:Protein kinase domain-containing protein n=1 Tax=Taxus chinensis TaxID=29808 RepID=A0AA38C4P5_TAXCH|nr:hypothetical protein KI387_033026 [Taxus chinensis]KAH9292738.1 hypothetical protein KI387_042074 [Taxus chinensis]
MGYERLIIRLILRCCSCLVFLLCICSDSYAAEPFNSTERDALLNLKNGLRNNTILLKSWSGPQCLQSQSRWKGVTCMNGRVKELLLVGMGLQGSIKENALLNLTELTAISFRENGLDGFLPNLSALSKLKFIDFSHNKFSGPMPEYFSTPWKHLKLQYNNLSGSIPLSLVNCAFLETLLVQKNNLTGTIPPFNQSSLKVLNVSHNNLSGSIPDTPTMQSFNDSSFLGNPGLCGKALNTSCPSPTPPAPSPSPTAPSASPTANTSDGSHGPSSSHRSIKLTIAEIVVPSVVALILIALLFYCYFRMKAAKKAASRSSPKLNKNVEIIESFQSSSSGAEVDPKNKGRIVFTSGSYAPAFDIDELLGASAELLGRGNFGSTYRALLETGESVVVKRLKDIEGLTKKEFDQHMECISKLQHRNLVPIAAYYFSKDEKLIVCNYMPNGSLFDRLHGIRGLGRMPLNWKSRLNIAQGIVRGMSFLHTQCPHRKSPHGNLKSSNVLLDEHLQPTLSDYGLAPLLTPKIASLRLMAYKAPEYLHTKRISPQADVWTFGVLLLELLTGKMYSTMGSPGVDLPEWVSSAHRVINWRSEIFDLEILVHKEALTQMVEMLDIALTCVDESPHRRPKMSEVLEKVERIKERDKEEENVSLGRFSVGEASSSSHSMKSVASSTV